MVYQELRSRDQSSDSKSLGPIRDPDDGDINPAGSLQNDKLVLRRFMGILPTISFILGLIIGTGIFLTPAGVLRGSSGSIGISFIVWLVGAFVQATGAMCLMELALYFRQSGGDFVYLNEAYGPAAGFINVIMTVLVSFPCSSAIQSIVIVKFLVTPFIGDCDPISDSGYKAGATCVFMLAVFINCTSTNWTSRVQVFLMFIKVGALLLIIVMGGVWIIAGGAEGKFAAPFATSTGGFQWSEIPSAFFSAYFALGGWNNIANIVEEVKHPSTTIVRAMLISLLCTTSLYLLANLAYFAVLTPEEIMASDAVAALFAVRVVGVRWSFIIWFCVVLSAAGILNGGTFATARVYFVAARAKRFPFILSTIHIRRRTPLAAILSTFFPTMIVLWSGDIWSVINFIVCLRMFISIVITLIVPYLRWTQPDRKLPYKAPLWCCAVYVLFSVALLLMAAIVDPLQIGIGAAVIAVSLLLYALYKWTDKSAMAADTAKTVNNFLQKLLLSVEQEADTF